MPVHGIVVSGAGAAAFLLCHGFWWRRSARGAADAVRFLVCLAAGYGAALGLACLAGGSPRILLWSSIPGYALLMTLYGHLYAGVLRSVSVRILGELHTHHGALTWDELDQYYPLRAMFGERLQSLVRVGLLRYHDGIYECLPKGRRAAHWMCRLAAWYGIRAAG